MIEATKHLNAELAKKVAELEALLHQKKEELKKIEHWSKETAELQAHTKKIHEENEGFKVELFPLILWAHDLDRILLAESLVQAYDKDFPVEVPKEEAKPAEAAAEASKDPAKS